MWCERNLYRYIVAHVYKEAWRSERKSRIHENLSDTTANFNKPQSLLSKHDQNKKNKTSLKTQDSIWVADWEEEELVYRLYFRLMPWQIRGWFLWTRCSKGSQARYNLIQCWYIFFCFHVAPAPFLNFLLYLWFFYMKCIFCKLFFWWLMSYYFISLGPY